MAYIVADDRERNVHPHLAGLLPGRVQKHRISIGDFLICRPGGEAGAPPTVVACIERKTYADFAATLKGPRYANREKMFHLRSQTGCQLYYLVEGPAFPSPNGYIKGGGGMKYQSILSAMTTLPLASGVHIMQTSDTAHTALRLRDMVAALDKIPCPYTYPVEGAGAVPAHSPHQAQPAHQARQTQPAQPVPAGLAPAQPAPAGLAPTQPTPLAIPELVTGTYETDPDTQCMELWKKMTGISQDTAKVLVKAHSLCEFMTTRPNVDQIKTPTGRTLVKKGRDSLKALQLGKLETAAKVLSGVNGLTLPVASEILMQINAPNPLYALGTGSPYRAAELTITQKSRKIRLGAKKVERIQRLLNWKSQDPGAALGAPAPPAAPPNVSTAPPNVPHGTPPSAAGHAPPNVLSPAPHGTPPLAAGHAPPNVPPPASFVAPPLAPPGTAPPFVKPPHTRPSAASAAPPAAMATADAPAAVAAKIQALPSMVPMHPFASAAPGRQTQPRADVGPSALSDEAAALCVTADLGGRPTPQTKQATTQSTERDRRAETPPELVDELFYKAMSL